MSSFFKVHEIKLTFLSFNSCDFIIICNGHGIFQDIFSEIVLFSIFPENRFKITATSEDNVVKMSPQHETVKVVMQSWFWKNTRRQPAKHKKINRFYRGFITIIVPHLYTVFCMNTILQVTSGHLKTGKL